MAGSEGTKRERTRERILDVAFAHIKAKGIRRLAMDAVASEAGLSRAALYQHFANKQALVDAVLEANSRRFRVELATRIDGLPTLADKVGAAARFGHFPPRDLVLLGLTETDPTALSMLLTTDAHRFLERATRFWTPHVQEALDAGELAKGLDVAQAAEWVARSFFALATIPPRTIDAEDPDAMDRYARTFVLAGLRR